MTQMNLMKSHLKSIESILSKLENGNLALDELEVLVENSRELFEIALVLRHKAYEINVNGQEMTHENQIINESIEPTQEEEQPELFNTVQVEINELNSETESNQPILEFNLFEDPQTDQGDLFADEQQPIDSKAPEVITSAFDDQSSAEEPIETANESNYEPFQAVESIVVALNTKDSEMNSDAETDLLNIPESNVINEDLEIITKTNVDHEFITRFADVNPNLTGQIGMAKLDTLIGSFGLNERLQYINELFDGSSEALSNAVKTLDNVANYSQALMKIAELSDQYQWDLNSETVEEFMLKIQRRHV